VARENKVALYFYEVVYLFCEVVYRCDGVAYHASRLPRDVVLKSPSAAAKLTPAVLKLPSTIMELHVAALKLPTAAQKLPNVVISCVGDRPWMTPSNPGPTKQGTAMARHARYCMHTKDIPL
jgi:hypothetical protein